MDSVCLLDNRVSVNCDIPAICPEPFLRYSGSEPSWESSVNFPQFRLFLNPYASQSFFDEDVLSLWGLSTPHSDRSLPCPALDMQMHFNKHVIPLHGAFVEEYAPGQCHSLFGVFEASESTPRVVLGGRHVFKYITVVLERAAEKYSGKVCLMVPPNEVEGEIPLADNPDVYMAVIEKVNGRALPHPTPVVMDTGGEYSWIDDEYFFASPNH